MSAHEDPTAHAWGELREVCQRAPSSLFDWGRVFAARAELLSLGAPAGDVARYILGAPAGFTLAGMEGALRRTREQPHQAAAHAARLACAAAPMRGRWSGAELLSDVGAPVADLEGLLFGALTLFEAARSRRAFGLGRRLYYQALAALARGVSVRGMASLNPKPTRRARRALRRELPHALFHDPHGARRLREPYRAALAELLATPAPRLVCAYHPRTLELAEALKLDTHARAGAEVNTPDAHAWALGARGQWPALARWLGAYASESWGTFEQRGALVDLLCDSPHAPGLATLRGMVERGDHTGAVRTFAMHPNALAWVELLGLGGCSQGDGLVWLDFGIRRAREDARQRASREENERLAKAERQRRRRARRAT